MTINATAITMRVGPGGVLENIPPEGLGSTDQIIQYGITWNFNATVEYGAFIAGDYYIIDPGSGVIATIPGDSAVNGSELNPAPGSTSAMQGLNSDGVAYQAARRVSSPVSLVAGDSLVSSIGNGGSGDFWNGDSYSSATDVKTVAVLTVLSSHPASGTFRPAPSDTSKTLYNTSQLNTSILPALSTSGISALETRNGYVGINYHLRGTERYWPMWGWDYKSRSIHASDNMLGYHFDIGRFISETMMVMVSDLATETLINQFVQVGIDNFHSDNNDSSNWSMWVVMTGLLLNESSIYNHWIDTSQTTQRDHEKFFYPSDDIYWDSVNTSVIVPSGEVWTGYVPSGEVPMFSKQTGPGAGAFYHEHLHPSEWDPGYLEHHKSEDYRAKFDVVPIVGMALAIRALEDNGATGAINMCQNDAAFDYMDRWMTEGYSTTSEYEETGKTFRQYVLETTGWGVTGDTPTPTINAPNGGYFHRYDSAGSSFMDDMWDTHRGVI